MELSPPTPCNADFCMVPRHPTVAPYGTALGFLFRRGAGLITFKVEPSSTFRLMCESSGGVGWADYVRGRAHSHLSSFQLIVGIRPLRETPNRVNDATVSPQIRQRTANCAQKPGFSCGLARIFMRSSKLLLHRPPKPQKYVK